MAGLKTHDIFYKELKKKLSSKILENYPNYDKYNVFAQGHDLFLYHNFYKFLDKKRVRENTEFSVKIQENGFREFVYNYINVAKKANVLNKESIRSFIGLGYITHHILDSYTHPYIIYLAGDHTPDVLNVTWQHGVTENMLDQYLIMVRENRNPKQIKVSKDFKFKKKLFDKDLEDVLNKSFFLTYGDAGKGSILRKASLQVKKLAKASKEDKYGLKVKILNTVYRNRVEKDAFSYNRDFFEVNKYLNKDKNYWFNPMFTDRIYNYSFDELFEKSMDHCKEIIENLEVLYKKEVITREDINKIIPDVASTHGGPCNMPLKINKVSKDAVKLKSVENEIIKKIKKGEKINKRIFNYIHSTNEKNFTSRFGMNMRKIFHPVVRFVVNSSATKENIFVKKAKLKKRVPYIFVPTHSFDDDLKTTVGSIDRNAYLVLGLTEQLKFNPEMYFSYIGTGMIHVFKDSKVSRKNAFEKMKRVINNKNSIIIYPEGAYNHSQNKIMLDLYDSIFFLAKETGAEIVPIASYSRYDYDKIYTIIDEPISVSGYEIENKKEFMTMLRDKLATNMWYLMEDYAPKVKRSELGVDALEEFYYDRMHEYLGVLWDPRNDNWIDEEIIAKNENEKENTEKFKEYVRANWKEAQEIKFLKAKNKK